MLPGRRQSSPHRHSSLSALLSLLLSHFGGEVLWLELQPFLLTLIFTTVQFHHVPTPSVVKGGRYSGSAVQVLPARAGDHHLLSKQRALVANFLVECGQVFGCLGISLCRSLREETPGLLVVLGDAMTELVANAEIT